MKNKLSKTEAKERIREFFKDVKNKSSNEIKKIKKFAMRYSIPLKEKRKLFCGKCYSAYRKPKIRIRKGVKSVECEGCGDISRWRL